MKVTRNRARMIEALMEQPYVRVGDQQECVSAVVDDLNDRGEPVARWQGRRQDMAKVQHYWQNAFVQTVNAYTNDPNRKDRAWNYLMRGYLIVFKRPAVPLHALVKGSGAGEFHEVKIAARNVSSEVRAKLKQNLAPHVKTEAELLQANPSLSVQRALQNKDAHVFPRRSEIEAHCSCPDFAKGHDCKHMLAVLFGMAKQLETTPKMLFTLRGLKASELLPKRELPARQARVKATSRLSRLFNGGVQKVRRSRELARPVAKVG